MCFRKIKRKNKQFLCQEMFHKNKFNRRLSIALLRVVSEGGCRYLAGAEGSLCLSLSMCRVSENNPAGLSPVGVQVVRGSCNGRYRGSFYYLRLVALKRAGVVSPNWFVCEAFSL